MSREVDDAGIGPVATRSGRRKRDGRGGGVDHRPRTRPRTAPTAGVPVVSGHEDEDRENGEILPTVMGDGSESVPPKCVPTATDGQNHASTGIGEEGAVLVPRFESLPTELMSIILEFMDLSSLVRVARCGTRFEKLVHTPGTRMYLKVYFGTLPRWARPSKDPAVLALIRFLERIDALVVAWLPALEGWSVDGLPRPSRFWIISRWSPSCGAGDPTWWNSWLTTHTPSVGGVVQRCRQTRLPLQPFGHGRDWRDILSSSDFLGMKLFVEVGGDLSVDGGVGGSPSSDAPEREEAATE